MASIDRAVGLSTTGGDPFVTDGTTLATLYVTEDGATYQVPDIARFTYSSDVLTLGDPWSAVVPDPRGRYRGKLRVGSLVELWLANPYVVSGLPTRKLRGRIVRRVLDVGDGGSVIQLSGYDLGWHLKGNPAPWFSLRGVTWQKFLDKLIDSGWGFAGTRLGNDINQRLNNGRQAKILALQPKLALDPFARIETMPGETIGDLIVRYARRRGLLVNVSGDGYLQTFAPDYNETNNPPLYKLRYYDDDDPRSTQNNMRTLQVIDDGEPLYTDVTCIAQSVYTPKDFANGAALTGAAQNIQALNAASNAGSQGVQQGDVHAGQHPRTFSDRGSSTTVLPFTRRKTFADGEMFSPKDAYVRALWAYNRGRFDAQTIRVRLRGHWQQQDWWESGTMCDIDIDTTQYKLSGSWYVQRVELQRAEGVGDVTDVTLKPPDLLYEVPVL